MPTLVWPGPGVDADILVLQHVLGRDVSKILRGVDYGSMPPALSAAMNNRVMVPPYTRSHAVAVVHIVEALEDEGYFFTVGNEGGRYMAKLRKAGQEWKALSRYGVADAICIVALQAKGFEVKNR